ncbi:MAG: hypothetical protein K2Z25_08370 [Beijerinckiaceae bacterium]|nr:hypothetical protein [Beijerinckiaceae bacterium]
MDRRSFLTTLIGGFAAAGLGGVAVAQAAGPVEPKLVPGDDALGLDSAALDKTDAEFSQYYYYRRRPRWRRRYYYRRPYGYYRRRRFYGGRRRFDWRARAR